jgi:hypothetical protein
MAISMPKGDELLESELIFGDGKPHEVITNVEFIGL